MATNAGAILLPPPGATTNAGANARASTNAPPDLRPLKTSLPFHWSTGMTIAALLLAALLGALAYWWWRRRQRVTVPVPVPVVPPHERARARLREALDLMDQPKPFCVLVSDTLRLYLEERFSLRAPERTTEEFLEELAASPKLSYEQKRTLGDFLTRCDLVKFACYEPLRPELQEVYDVALKLIEETEPPPILATSPPANSTAAPTTTPAS